MPRVNRNEIFAEDEIQAFHCVNRCVRRTFLCGRDEVTGRDFTHRKRWIRERLEVLAGLFGIDILGFAVMSNHLHVVVRTRPDVVAAWADDEVALRWWRLFPQRKDEDGNALEPTEFELNAIRNDTSGLKEKRKRLSNVSWFMKCLAEPIAKRGNREEKVTGHFWEGRFKAQPLLDEMAIAACMAYVDLNPIRAGLAATPETSEFTSVKERIEDAFGKCSVGSVQCSKAAEAAPSSGLTATFSPGSGEKELDAACAPDAGEKGLGEDARDEQIEHGERAGWLAPIELGGCSVFGFQCSENRRARRRASDKGCLPMTLLEYLRLVDWTGRQLRCGKTGRIPAAFAPLLERLECSGESWLDLVKNFPRRFRTEAGLARSVASFRTHRQTRSSTSTPPTVT